MLIIFFSIEEIIHKEFVLAGQIVKSTYYCDVLQRLRENVRMLRRKLWRQKNWLFHHDNSPSHTFFFTWEFLTKNKMTVIPHPPYFSMFPQLKIKLKGRHFDMNEVIEAECQVVLNTFTEHHFRDAFITWQKHWEQYISSKEGYFEGDVDQ
jgi:hypothetical protein